MKKEFSTLWESSKQPRKQRKYRANAPLHIKRKFLSVNLSKELRKKHGKRNLPVIKNDKIKILRGKFKGKQGKITGVLTKLGKVTVEGIQINKIEGSKVDIKLQPSNLQIIELNLEDPKRSKKLGVKAQKKESKKEEVKKEKKPEKPKEPEEKKQDIKKEIKEGKPKEEEK